MQHLYGLQAGHCDAPHPPIVDDRKSLLIAFLAISDQYATFFFTKLLPAAILDDRKSLSIAFLAISDQYATFFFLIFGTKWLPVAILDGTPKITFDRISRHFRSIHILEVRFLPKTIGFFPYVLSMAMPNMKLIGEFMTELENPQGF